MKSYFSVRLKEALDRCGMTQEELSRKTGIPKAAISHYIHNRYEPKQDRVLLIQQALGVPYEYLLGYDLLSSDELNEEIISLFASLREDKKKEALRYLRYLSESGDT